MKFQTRETIKRLEENIQNSYSLPIFKGYKAINKSGVEKLIDELYANLPDDVRRAREYLKERQYDFNSESNKNIFDVLKMFECTLDEGFPFAQLIIINIREIEELLRQIQNNLPDEILKAEILDK